MAKKHAKINGKSICYFRSSIYLGSVPIVLSIISVYTFLGPKFLEPEKTEPYRPNRPNAQPYKSPCSLDLAIGKHYVYHIVVYIIKRNLLCRQDCCRPIIASIYSYKVSKPHHPLACIY